MSEEEERRGEGGGWEGESAEEGELGNDHVHTLLLFNFVTGMNSMWNLRALGSTRGVT